MAEGKIRVEGEGERGKLEDKWRMENARCWSYEKNKNDPPQCGR